MSIVDDGGAQTEADDSDNDFAPQRRPTVPRATSNSLGANTTSIAEAAEAGDSSTCPICFEGWTISGSHRLASLKCGHLFGRSCIRKWLSQRQNSNSHQQQSARAGGGKSCCPECKQPATLRDVRILFARSVTAVDGARLEDLKAENKRLATELSAVRGESTEYKIKHQQMLNEVKRLRAELDAAFEKSQWMQMENSNLASRIAELSAAATLKGQQPPGSFDYDNDVEEKEDPDPGHQAPSDAAAYVPRMRLRATVAVAAEAGRSSRVLAFDPHCAVIYASHSQAAQHQHTMALIDVHNPSRTPSLVSPHLHGMEIRGAEVSPVHTQGGARYLLTASHDQTAALTALGADGTRAAPKLAARLALGAPAWSCAWDAHDAHLCYVGTAGCAVLAFDLRHAAQPLHTWSGVRDRASLLAGSDPGSDPGGAPGALVDTGYSQIHSIAVVRGGEDAQQQRQLVAANSCHVYALPAEPGTPWTQLTRGAGDHQPRRACYALSYDAGLGCVAASFRTHVDGAPSTVHDVYAARLGERGGGGGGALDWRLLQRIPSPSPQNKLARSAVFSFVPPQAGPVRRRQGLFCAVLEAARSVNVWALDAAAERTRAPIVLADALSPEDIVDVRGWQWSSGEDGDGSSTTLLASLTNSTIRLYDVR